MVDTDCYVHESATPYETWKIKMNEIFHKLIASSLSVTEDQLKNCGIVCNDILLTGTYILISTSIKLLSLHRKRNRYWWLYDSRRIYLLVEHKQKGQLPQ